MAIAVIANGMCHFGIVSILFILETGLVIHREKLRFT